MPRLQALPDADLSPEQAAVCAEARSGPGAGFRRR